MVGPAPLRTAIETLADTLKVIGLLLAGPLSPMGNFGTALNVWVDGALGTLWFTLDKFADFGGFGYGVFGSGSVSVFLSRV